MRAGLIALVLVACVTEAPAQSTKPPGACTVGKCIVNQTTNRVDPRTGNHYTEAQARRWCPANLSKSTACN